MTAASWYSVPWCRGQRLQHPCRNYSIKDCAAAELKAAVMSSLLLLLLSFYRLHGLELYASSSSLVSPSSKNKWICFLIFDGFKVTVTGRNFVAVEWNYVSISLMRNILSVRAAYRLCFGCMCFLVMSGPSGWHPFHPTAPLVLVYLSLCWEMHIKNRSSFL